MSNPTTIVIGASRGFGAAVVDALVGNGHDVIAVARDVVDLNRRHTGGSVTTVAGDGRDGDLARALITGCAPTAIVVGGGAVPHMAPLEQHSLDTLALHWHHDVAIAFTWLRAAILEPSEALRDVIVISSGAGVFGSPGSGGYAGAKATTRFLTASAADSSKRLGLTTRFTCINPELTTATAVGRTAAEGYARFDAGSTSAARNASSAYTAEHAGRHIVGLITDPPDTRCADYLLAASGLLPLGLDR